MRCFVVAGFLLTSASRGPSAIAEPLVLNFGVRGVIADIITHASFFVNAFRDVGVLTPRNFPISIRLAGRSYNSVSTAVLHCDSKILVGSEPHIAERIDKKESLALASMARDDSPNRPQVARRAAR